MSHLYKQALALGFTGRDADRYGHAGGPSPKESLSSAEPLLGTPTGTPTPAPNLDPFTGGPMPPGVPPAPKQSDFFFPTLSGGRGDPDVAEFQKAWSNWLSIYDAVVPGGLPGEAGGGTGRTGPTAAELEIERSKVQSANLATFLDGTISSLSADIDAKRLSTDQALDEFNRRLDAFAEAGKQFRDIQEFTIPIGAEFAPGFGPGEIGERLGIEPRKAEVVQFDPFAQATDIVNQTPVLTDVGAPSGDELRQAIELARGFL